MDNNRFAGSAAEFRLRRKSSRPKERTFLEAHLSTTSRRRTCCLIFLEDTSWWSVLEGQLHLLSTDKLKVLETSEEDKDQFLAWFDHTDQEV